MKKVPMNRKIPMNRKVPVAPPKRAGLAGFREKYGSHPEAQSFLEVFSAMESRVFSNASGMPSFALSGEETEVTKASKTLKAKLESIQDSEVKAAAEDMMKSDAHYWDMRYQTASGVYYSFSNWSSVLSSIVKVDKNVFPDMFAY